MQNQMLIDISIILGIILFYFIFRNINKYDKEFERLYFELLTSDKYKVKGKND